MFSIFFVTLSLSKRTC